ncbi:glycosyltransferase family 4 protein [Urechidicola sp. KH5]
MNIGMILDYTFPPDPRVENEAVALSNAGHDVYLFCLNYGDQPIEEHYKGFNVRRYKWNKFIYKLSALAYTVPFYHWYLQPRLNHFLKSNAIEAIHIHDIRIAQAVFNVSKKKLPIVLDLHDNMPEIMKLYPHLQKFPGKYIINPMAWKRREEQFIKTADYVITVSQEFVEEVVERTSISPEKIRLVPNTVQQSFYKNAVIDDEIIDRFKDKFVLLYLGDTGLRRGLQTAIAAMPEILKTIPNAQLIIVGKNSTDHVLKAEAINLNLEDEVCFEGWQNVSLFPSYIKASDVCISPLKRNIQHDVAYANKLFQYMSFERPLVVSNAIAQAKLIERTNTGLVHEEQNSKDFASKIIALYNNEILRKEMGVNGKAFIENEFCWEKTSETLVALYQNLKA